MDHSWEQRLGFLSRIHWEKTVIWALFLFFIYVVSGFFGLVFITFILCYIFHHLSRWVIAKLFGGSTRTGVRILVVTVLYLLLTGGITSLLIFMGPGVYDNAAGMVAKVQRLEDQQRIERNVIHLLEVTLDEDKREGTALVVKEVLAMPEEEAEQARARLEAFLESKGFDPGGRRTAAALDSIMEKVAEYRRTRGLKNIITSWICHTFKVERTAEMDRLVNEVEGYAMEHLPAMVNALNSFLGSLFHGMLNMILAVIFSFIILLDLPRIGRRVDMLSQSRIHRFYEEIRPTMIGFATVIGKAFQAQTVIAFLNTAFTFVGMQILGMDHAIVLSIIVFACSFVPVAGVFISTTPMVLVALQVEGGGVSLGLQVIGLVTIIHMLEAYVFNPRIMGEFLHMHPIFVLLILVVAEHFFHIWGLLLGVPVVYYVFTQVLNNREDRPRTVEGS